MSSSTGASSSTTATTSPSTTGWRKINAWDRKQEIVARNDEIDKMLLDVGKTTIKNLKSSINQTFPNKPTVMNFVQYFLGEKSHFQASLNERFMPATKAHKVSPLEEGELFTFLEYILTCHVYNRSPSHLDNAHFTSLRPRPTMPFARFNELANCFNPTNKSPCRGYDPNIGHLFDAIKNFSTISSKLDLSVVTIDTVEVFSLDDFKIYRRSKGFPDINVAQRYIQGHSPGPIMDTIVNDMTGLVVSCHIKLRNEDTEEECIDKCLSLMSSP